MKKLLNKKFILILASTITLLVVLTIAMIFLTKENTKTFIQGGYIIASGKEEENSTKYYFDEGTSYKTNVNSELVFKDTSGEKVNVETNNFLHYKNGVEPSVRTLFEIAEYFGCSVDDLLTKENK